MYYSFGFLYCHKQRQRSNTQFHIKTLLQWPCDLYSLLRAHHTFSRAAKKLSAHGITPQRNCDTPSCSVCPLQIATVCANSQRKETELCVCFSLCIKSATSSGWPLRCCREPEGKILQITALHIFISLQWPSSQVTNTSFLSCRRQRNNILVEI